MEQVGHDNDLRLIKKHYGEDMMRFCRANFSTILDTPGLLYEIIKNGFDYSKSLYKDIVDAKQEEEFIMHVNAIYNKYINPIDDEYEIDKTPEELLDEAGYTLYECHTEDEIQSFRKYYDKLGHTYEKVNKDGIYKPVGEEICTFDGNRLNKCYVFFAVSKNVDNIKRKEKPERQDEYGTSVISIQFLKGKINIVSIKNRYNHSVKNCDATFSNNLDLIIRGLKKSFEKKYDLRINSNYNEDIILENYTADSTGKFYKVNAHANNRYYCANNKVIYNGEVKSYDKAQYILMDCYLLDIANKKIELVDPGIKDGFIKTIGNINSLDIKNYDDGSRIITINNGIEITIDANNTIKEYKDTISQNIESHFLSYSEHIESVNMTNAIIAGKDFLRRSTDLRMVDLPLLESTGENFCRNGKCNELINMPSLKATGNNFMYHSFATIVDFPNLVNIGDFFFGNGIVLEVNLPKTKKVGDAFLGVCQVTKKVNMPVVETIGAYFMAKNNVLKELYLPAYSIKENFLEANQVLQKLELPNIDDESWFMLDNRFVELIAGERGIK